MILTDIPSTDVAGEDATPSPIVARIRQVRPSRRTVLKGLLVAAAAAALVPLDWVLTRRPASAGPTSEFSSCQPRSYQKEANNWWKEDSPGAICWGGWRRGSFPCVEGFHREGTYKGRGETYTSTRMSNECGGKNAWRWNGYRCSDALTETVFDDGDTYKALTISGCALADSEAQPSGDSPSTQTTPRPSRSSEPDESQDSESEGRDGAPRR
jgi:hypothetical protein